jgi:hypothetical protein
MLNRLRAGYCQMVNPYGGQVYRIPLTRDQVEGIVFWTKNVGPFLDGLREVRAMGYPFVVQYAINGYPRALERAVTDARRAVEHMRLIAETYGPRVGVWRYDTIVFTSETPAEFHAENFARLASALEGSTDEAVISFAQIYRKTKRNMDAAARESGFAWEDPDDGVKGALGRTLADCARAHGMKLAVCSQRQFLAPGIEDAACIDTARMSDVAGRAIHARKRGNRPDCGCWECRDIGEYDTCPQGCAYCYAVQRRELALQRYKLHDPEGEFLFAPTQISQAPAAGEQA